MNTRTVLAIILCLSFGSCSREQTTQRVPLPAASADIASAAVEAEAEAVNALARMIGYLRTFQQFEVVSDTTTDEVLDDGLTVQLGSRAIYRVRKPNAFFVDVQSDRRWRQIFYDRNVVTMFAPRVGFYAEIPAPPTILGALQVAANDYGVELPLSDLFFWALSPQPAHDFLRATTVGYARIGDTDTTQYAFREPDLEWQLWITSGEQPLPRKVAITNLTDDARPTYTALLTWNLTPRFTSDAFTFRPSPGNRQIPISLAMADSGAGHVAQ